jgi:hypothetical protein
MAKHKHIGISKSRYTLFRQCPKALWLKTYKPEEAVVSDALRQRFEAGDAVGDLAMGLFSEFMEVTAYTSDGRLDLGKMAEETRKCLDAGVEVICEASFFHDGSYCAVDILKKEDVGYAIYEVKSSTDADKEVYAQDVAYQKYILENSGINVTSTYLVCIDSGYVLDGELDIYKLFQIQDISEAVAQEYPLVASQVATAKKMLSNMNVEPDEDLDAHCHNPYDCAFWKYCSGHLPEKSVFNLYRMNFSKKIEYYQQGVASFEQLKNEALNEKQQMQVNCTLNDTIYINKVEIAKFLSTLSYPLYFLDFETMQPVIPEYWGTHPYQQIPFQYSLHYIEEPDGELKNKEFLGVSGEDPRRALAEQLCKDIPMNVCVTAYNKAFECTRMRELAETFPDLSEHLLNIRDHIIDLLIPFQSGWYYVPAMGGSFSIKSVLPALFPNDPELDYHNLQGSVHNGSEAMNIFPKIKDMLPEEQQAARQSLLKYCELDTYAMVKVWQKLKEVVR